MIAGTPGSVNIAKVQENGQAMLGFLLSQGLTFHEAVMIANSVFISIVLHWWKTFPDHREVMQTAVGTTISDLQELLKQPDIETAFKAARTRSRDDVFRHTKARQGD